MEDPRWGGTKSSFGTLALSDLTGNLALTKLEIDGGTDIGADLADADLLIVDDGAGGTNRKTAASSIKTYVADVTLTTAAQTNITSLGTLTALTVSGVATASTFEPNGDTSAGDNALDTKIAGSSDQFTISIFSP